MNCPDMNIQILFSFKSFCTDVSGYSILSIMNSCKMSLDILLRFENLFTNFTSNSIFFVTSFKYLITAKKVNDVVILRCFWLRRLFEMWVLIFFFTSQQSINQILKSSKINLYLVGKSHISFAQPFTKKRERRRSGEFKLGDFNFSRDFVAHFDCY